MPGELHLDHDTRKDALPCLPGLHSRHPRRATILFYQTNPPYVFFISRISFWESSTCQPATREHQAKHFPFHSNNRGPNCPPTLNHALPRPLDLHSQRPRSSGIFFARTKLLYVLFINTISGPESTTCQPKAREHQAKWRFVSGAFSDLRRSPLCPILEQTRRGITYQRATSEVVQGDGQGNSGTPYGGKVPDTSDTSKVISL